MNALSSRLAVLILITCFQIGCAQINIFEVPNNDTLGKGEVFVQIQCGVTDQQLKFGAVSTWGLGNDFEVGLTMNQLSVMRKQQQRTSSVEPEKPGESPSLLINARKGITITPIYRIGFGARIGVSVPPNHEPLSYPFFTFLINQFKLPDSRNSFVLGSYLSNKYYGGEGNNAGIMAGFEFDIIKEKMAIAADFLSGNNLLSVINAGIEIELCKNWKIGVAGQIPTPGSSNPQGAFVQISRN